MPDRRSSVATWLLLGAIVALGAAMRFAGITFGTQDAQSVLVHPDEVSVANALQTLSDGEIPYFLIAYGGGYFFPMAAFARVLAAVGGPDAWNASSAYDAVLAARAWSALVSTGTIAVAFATGRRLRSRTCGLVAAFLVAGSLLAVRDAHIGKADSTAALATALVILTMISLDARRWTSFALLGAACGFALSTKYGIGSLPAVGLAVLAELRAQREISTRALLAFAITAATTTLALGVMWLRDPVLCWELFHRLLASQAECADPARFEGVVPSPLAHHLGVSLRHGCGLGLTLLAPPAMLYGVARRGGTRWIVIALLGQFAVLVSNPLALARNFEPLVPGLCVLVATLLSDASERLPAGARSRHAGLLLVTLLVGVAPLVDAIRLTRVLRATDTRTLAIDWMGAHLPADEPISCLLPTGAPMACPAPFRLRVEPRVASARYVVRPSYPAPFVDSPPPPSGELLASFDPFTGPDAQPVIERLDLFLLPLAGFAGVERPGPRIDIYRVDAPPATASPAP